MERETGETGPVCFFLFGAFGKKDAYSRFTVDQKKRIRVKCMYALKHVKNNSFQIVMVVSFKDYV